MIVAPAADEIESFRSLVARRLGLHFDAGKLDFLADVLRKRMEDTGCPRFSSYHERVASGPGESDEICALAEQLTVGETYFFRYAEHFAAFAEIVLPARIQARGGDHRLRILSAGCASGEEPYSLAILIHQRFPDLAGWDIEILGLDVNPSVIAKARKARFSSWSLRETPDEVRLSYFRPDAREFQLNATVKSSVRFEERNLVCEDPLFWRPDTFDVIFCRNVIMYFAAEVSRSVVARMALSIAPGGFLFLGHAETLRAVSHDFHLRHTHGTFYYQRKTPETAAQEIVGNVPVDGGLIRKAAPILADPDGSWFSIIRAASERIANLTEKKPTIASGARGLAGRREPASHPPQSSHRLRAIELLRSERFSDAMELLRALPADSNSDPDTQLLLAALHTNVGDLGEAEGICRRILDIDELHAGAHYLMALCREHAGDRPGAVRHDQTAAYLDSGFAMPHLHLGLMARRSADSETARRELTLAIPLLDHEDASRILLFGGGFTREALMEFCRAELRACGGVS